MYPILEQLDATRPRRGVYDVVVVGSGNAGFCAAHAALERGSSVLMLEKAPPEWFGGNSYFTAGAIRMAHDGIEDLRSLVELDDELADVTDLPAYSRAEFLEDLRRTNGGRGDERLAQLVADDSADTVRWLRRKGLQFRLMYDRQAYQVNGRHRFWGGLALGTVDGGQGLVTQHLSAGRRDGLEICCDAAVCGLAVGGDGEVVGVRYRRGDTVEEIRTATVVLASGGFEASAELRARELGAEWARARVRGTPYNTGEMLEVALRLGAARCGQWDGCHAIAWDAAAPPAGDRELTNRLSRQSYPVGIVVNRRGRRFVDEGADFRNYTYAKYGGEILRQPGGVAFQLFDAKCRSLLRDKDYGAPGATFAEAETVRELAVAIDVDPDQLEATVTAFNAAVRPGPFDPSIKDGKHTIGIDPPKSNWARPLDESPFLAFAVTCGITFTFGGLRVSEHAEVLDTAGRPIPGLFAAGELVGDLFHTNYPGGAGLTSGAVFGRRAGLSAARRAADVAASKDAADAVAGHWVTAEAS